MFETMDGWDFHFGFKPADCGNCELIFYRQVLLRYCAGIDDYVNLRQFLVEKHVLSYYNSNY